MDVTKLPGEPPVKVTKGPPAPVREPDPNSSDHVVAMTQLKEQIASLQKQIIQKDQNLFAKDKQVRRSFYRLVDGGHWNCDCQAHMCTDVSTRKYYNFFFF